MREEELGRAEGVLVRPEGEARSAVLVLAGSSGRVETDRARLLARHGAAALAVRWFGGRGQPPGICEVPLESIRAHVDFLAEMHPRVAILGTPKGAEAALLVACRDARVQVTVAASPSSVAWANLGPGRDGAERPYRSSWTWGGQPVPFVPYDDDWAPPETSGEPVWRELYETSLRTFAARVAAATIPVEDIAGSVIVSAGSDDQVWPSAWFADQVQARRRGHGLTTHVLTHPRAGHRVLLPGEGEATGGAAMNRGGEAAADRALGARVWTAMCGAGLLDPTVG